MDFENWSRWPRKPNRQPGLWLARYGDGESGGHQAAAAMSWEKVKETERREFVRVNEASWHPLFTQDRWFDLDVLIRDSVPNPVPTLGERDIWSVDTPALWDELRVNVELADRLLERVAMAPW